MKYLPRPGLVALAAALLVVAPACRRRSVEGATLLADEKASVVVYDGLGVRAGASRNAKFLSSLTLGESVKWLGGKEHDENGKEYLKVALSDGQEGWVQAGGIVTGAKVGAVLQDSPLSRRPDPLASSGQKAAAMAIVAATQEKDGWLQVTGEGHKPLGWVSAAAVTFERDEVRTAILATRKLREKDGLDRLAKVEAIARTAPNPASPFIQRLREQLANAPAAPPASSAPAAP